MNDVFDHTKIEDRWQKRWEEEGIFHTTDSASNPAYVLEMFPYTSGKLHMGHVRNYTITDAYGRYKRMQGEEVLHPIGWDSFGLPAENAAIKHDTNPRDWTMSCIETMREQMQMMGFGYDWDREITTCLPEYYRWNQWLFNRFYENGLVERKASEVNWCPSCETVLADEQVEGDDEVCWRCDSPVERRDLDQWFLKITQYADELVEGLDELDGWPDNVREMQRDWIGRQYGSSVEFDVERYGPVEVFTTRLDTIFGVTFLALSPDHEIAEDVAADDEEVAHFVEAVADPEGDEPQGVETSLTATNPATGETVPVFVADFVLSDIGTGALMGVPGHDDRDHAFAEKMGLDIVPVVTPGGDEIPDVESAAFTENGVLVNSGEYTGLESETARERFEEDFPSADYSVQYKLRDWGISRQRYWGTPIPIVHCESCGPVTVPDEDLPVELPEFVNTTGNPLDEVDEFVETTCPHCGEPARRETDTMDTFIDSSWYFLRYISPDLETAPFDTERANDWMPVDQYVGGIEHAVMHLLYSRFVTKVLVDLEMLDHREPFRNLVNQGMVLLEGSKMSKSKGNVVSPQEIVKEYGADTARLFMMQAAQPTRDFNWTDEGVRSSHQLLETVYDLVESFTAETPTGDHTPAANYVGREVDHLLAVAQDSYESLTFNAALREVREVVSLLQRYQTHAEPHAGTVERTLRCIVRILAPVAPHIGEELWEMLGGDGLVTEADWPTFDGDLSNVGIEQRLVEQTRSDVRQIVDVAGIDDPKSIEVVVAPEWKFEAHELARTTESNNVVGEMMQREEIRRHGDAAADFGKDLQAERQSLTRQLPPTREVEVLDRVTWLLEQEFDADVTVRIGEPDEDLISKARPGRPALEIA